MEESEAETLDDGNKGKGRETESIVEAMQKTEHGHDDEDGAHGETERQGAAAEAGPEEKDDDSVAELTGMMGSYKILAEGDSSAGTIFERRGQIVRNELDYSDFRKIREKTVRDYLAAQRQRRTPSHHLSGLDHIPQCHNAPYDPVVVPCLVTAAYIGLVEHSFSTFRRFDLIDHETYFVEWADRGGTSSSATRSSDGFAGSRVLSGLVGSVLPFLQAWCFFGLLRECLHPGLDVEIMDFLEECEWDRRLLRISTARLPAMLAAWAEAAAPLSPEEKAAAFVRLNRAFGVVDEITATVGRGLEALRGSERSLDFTLGNLVHLSVLLVSEALQQAALVIFLSPELAGSQYGMEKLRSVRTRKLNDLVALRLTDAGWCIKEKAVLERQFAGFNIHSCLFMASTVDRRMDRRDHSRCSVAECRYDVVQEEGYKSVHADGCEGCDETVVEDARDFAEDTGQMGPISQLVSEGKTPLITLRDMPGDVCAVEIKPSKFTSDGKERLDNSYIAISHVWAQGLGNPARNALPLCQIKRIQRLANDLVPAAARPVPFWMDTLCVPLRKPYRNQAIAGMKTTYNDAAMVLVLDTTLTALPTHVLGPHEVLLRILVSPWTRRLWTFQEASLAKDLFFQFADAAFCLETFVEEANRTFRSPKLDPVWAFCVVALAPLMSRMAGPAEGDQNVLTYFGWQLSLRSTSRQEDEAVCLASLLRRDLADILAAPGPDRMRRLLASLSRVPSDIIFTRTPRYEEVGSRWIPRSLLWNPVRPLLRPGHLPAELTPNGLVVSWPGVRFELPASPADEPRRLEKIFFEAEGAVFRVDIDRSLVNDSRRPLGPSAALGVVLKSPLFDPGSYGFLTGERSRPGVLVSVTECVADCVGCVLEVDVDLRRTDAGAVPDDAGFCVGARSLPASQKWCIR